MKKHLLLVIPTLIVFAYSSHAQTSLQFDGLDDYVNCGNNFSLTNYTKEVWVKWDGVTGQNNIISGDLENQHALWAVGGKMRSGHNGQFGLVGDGEFLVPDEWTHYAVTYNGTDDSPGVNLGEMKMYKNGQLIEQNLIGGGFVLEKIYLAAFPDSNGINLNLFGGSIDDVRIWDHVRTAAEIANNYQTCLTGTEDGLVAFYDFEDGAGSTVAADLTGNGNDGTLIDMDIDNAWVEGVSDCGDDPVNPDSIEITSFYPNPTWNRVYLNLNRDFDRLQVRVYNRYGCYVRGKNVYGPTDYVFATLYGLRRGYYYVMVIDRDTWEYDYVRVYKRGYY
ncbi:MAG: LamG domain-containing protein [Flavobacteriaceae bacterium]|nr:LamG domain-containing protein [Flavobacteriaceae bacterium]